MVEISSFELVLITVSVITFITVTCCISCLCMKVSDLKMESYIVKMAKRKGVEIDFDKLDPRNCQGPNANENCTIMVPDVGIIL